MYNKRFCKDIENVENYEKAKADNFVGWHCHHRKGIDIPREELQALGMYYNRPADELIFLTVGEHRKLHKFSEETKKKLSESRKGKPSPNKGKRHSEESRKKLSEAHKGHTLSEETRKKIAEAMKNMSEEHKNKISEATKCTHWYNNGEINIRAKECPPGFVPGMLNK